MLIDAEHARALNFNPKTPKVLLVTEFAKFCFQSMLMRGGELPVNGLMKTAITLSEGNSLFNAFLHCFTTPFSISSYKGISTHLPTLLRKETLFLN